MAARRSSLAVGLDSSLARRVACRAAAVRSAPSLSHRAMTGSTAAVVAGFSRSACSALMTVGLAAGASPDMAATARTTGTASASPLAPARPAAIRSCGALCGSAAGTMASTSAANACGCACVNASSTYAPA